jgi:hypothetical protein
MKLWNATKKQGVWFASGYKQTYDNEILRRKKAQAADIAAKA